MEKTKDAAAVGAILKRLGLDGVFTEAGASRMELHTYADKEKVCTFGEHLDGLYVVAEGRLKVYHLLPSGKTMLLRFSKPPMLIGDAEWMGNEPAGNTVEAAGKATLLFLCRKDAMKTEMGNPAFLQFMIRNLSRKLNTLGNASSYNLLYPAENRVASYLLSLLPEARPHGGEKTEEEIRVSNLIEMAEMLGTSYRHLNRVLRQLEGIGVLERRRGVIKVLDERRLRTLADDRLYK
ncbi:Crp/Fnr family transcriptional regulator [Cohnella caldifontis]|uniref:Crp/Fnr family transcriptional regulator n=1 Tax=Cohnella caldifontis TaxID=3027471 RepID=UPI0023EC9CE1|nr:Crp/Fnr family transcriptional regulator [Cohnella sp. YIM B05605]